MKKINLKIVGVITFSLLSISTYAQQPWFVNGNTNAQLGGSLTPSIGTNQNRPLLLETNNINRQIIQNGGIGANAGRVAFGNNLPTNFIPQARLQLLQFGAGAIVFSNMFRTDGDQNLINRWQMFTGLTETTVTEKFRLYAIANSNNVALSTVQTAGRMLLQTGTAGLNNYRILIDSGGTQGGRVVIGNNLPQNFVPQARLHVYQDFAGPSVVMFQTNGSSAVENSWKMCTNPSPAVSNEIFKLFTRSAGFSTDVHLQASQPGARMLFNTTAPLPDTAITRMIITDGVLAGNTGFIGMGNNFLTPRSQLHLNDGIFPTYLQITNTATNVNPLLPAANDGFKLGIDSNGTAHVKQQEILPLIFYTGSNTGAIEDARIIPASASTLPLSNHGMVGIGNWTTATNITNPINAKLDIDGDLRIRTVTQRDTLTRVLVIDSADHNRVHWRSMASLIGNVTANNGVSVNATTGAVQLGVPCQDSLGNNNLPAITANAFSEDRVVAIGDFNLWFATYTGDKGGVGIGGQPASTPFCGTGNTLEISANGASKYGAASSSGLRFTHLTSDSLTIPVGINGVDNTKVLTVDNAGDVVLVDALVGAGGSVTADNGLSINPANNVQLGQLFTGTPAFTGVASLLNDREVPLDDFNLHFTGLGTQGVNQVSIGTPSPLPLLTGDANLTSKFSTYNEDDLIAGSFVSDEQNFSGSSFGFISNGQYVRTNMIGASGIAIRRNSDFAVGVYGSAEQPDPLGGGGAILRGVVGQVRVGSSFTGARAIGVHGIGENPNGGINYGGYFEGLNSPNLNYGVWASAPVAGSNRAGYFNGTVEIAGGPIITSDQMFKINVETISSATEILNQLKPRTYNMDVTNFSQFNFQDRMQYGFIAQEVEGVLPNLVHESHMPSKVDSLGNEIYPAVNYKSLNYNALIPITVQAVNELNAKNHVLDSINQNLQARLVAIENCINKVGICNGNDNGQGNHRENNQTVTLQNLNSIILDQNLPNPFAENTVINYNIPTDVMEAKLLFYDLNGRIIKELIIDERGESKLTVYGENLQSGVYTYSLIADGKLIATKKMVKK